MFLLIGFMAFLALQPAHLCAYKRAPARDPWPVPPPAPWRRWSGNVSAKPGARRRRKMRLLSAAYDVLRVLIPTLNWLLLGFPRSPCPECRAGAPMSSEQSSIVDRLLRHVVHFLSTPDFGPESLGRCSEKFDRLAKFIRELPASESEVDLELLLHDLRRAFDPYSKPFTAPAKHDDSDLELACADPLQAPTASPQVLGASRSPELQACRPVVASRVRWKYPPSFDPTPFLRDRLSRAAFADPNVLRKPADTWPKVPRAKVHASKAELLKLARCWDNVGALKIFREDQLHDLKECVGLFCVAKDQDWDRLILNPVVVNSRMHTLNSYTRLLGHGSQLCLVHIPDGFVARFCADDLAEFYYTVKVSDERAKRNCIGLAMSPDDIRAFKAYNPQQHYGRCFLALACLAMGDNLAVELAQQSHVEVLRCAGCMLPSQVVSFRKPFPRGTFCELLCIDDHLSVQVLSRRHAQQEHALRDTEVFARADAAYPRVGLIQHEKKKRNLSKGTFLGADIDGCVGLVSAPRDRVLVLMLCSAEIARKGAWIHVALFRRPALCVLDSAFKDAARLPASAVLRLSCRTRNELLALSLLGPVLQSDLRAAWCPTIYLLVQAGPAWPPPLRPQKPCKSFGGVPNREVTTLSWRPLRQPR